MNSFFNKFQFYRFKIVIEKEVRTVFLVFSDLPTTKLFNEYKTRYLVNSENQPGIISD